MNTHDIFDLLSKKVGGGTFHNIHSVMKQIHESYLQQLPVHWYKDLWLSQHGHTLPCPHSQRHYCSDMDNPARLHYIQKTAPYSDY